MLGNLIQLASTEGPHISLKADPVFTIGGITITNSVLYGIIVALGILAIGVVAARRAGVKPAGILTTGFEMALEFIVNMLEGILGSRQKAVKYAPIFGTFFIFIVLNNVSGLLPFVGMGVHVGEAPHSVPLFRPFTADLNGTIAMSVIAILTIQYLSIKESGFLGHLKHYFTDKPLNPINLFIGILEVFGELTRVASLSLRLFLNTAVGEILIAVFAYVGSYGASFTIFPIMIFEVLVALIQGYVFTVLCATYLGLAIHHGEEHEAEHSIDHTDSPKLKSEGASA
jgi:F-type H+-transporting ATPase subunit a